MTNSSEKPIITNEKMDSPYFQAYHNLKMNELFILKELNKHLPESIKQLTKKRKEDIKEGFGKFDEECLKDCEKVLSLSNELKTLSDKEWIDECDDVELDINSAKYDVFEVGKIIEGKIIRKSIVVRKEVKDFFQDAQLIGIFPQRINVFIRDMSLVYLIAVFEGFLQDIIEITFQKKPETLATSQKSVSYEDLVKSKDIDEVRQYMIEKEILSISHQDIEEINKYFDKFKIDISQFTDWEQFKERFYRRNILIHNSGQPNKLYRVKTGYEGEDKRLTVSQYYLEESISLFEDIGLMIAEAFYNKFE